MQGELDNSWAVLGEIYGGDAKLRELGLTIRRVRSTLDDADRLGARAKYVPVRAKFRTGDELLKLLVGPLYDDNPNIGVRELIQNAVDACREMEDVLAQRRHPVARPNLRRDADVVVFLEELEDGTGCLTVEDNGIGMTPRIICDYFLTAGASFRNCEAWHKQHDDETGTPRVLRSGRFGIGVLAAFLLGNEIHVSTRHVDEERGVAFSCRLEDPEVELRWTDRPVGTTIQIQIGNSRVVDRLVGDGDTPGVDWDWYGLERPRLARGMLLRRTRVPNRHNPSPILTGESWLAPAVSLPSPGSELPAKWRRINYPEFDDLHWTWELPWAMACNGILIGHPNLHASFC
ncbi:MAG: ATP-binding protein, partial [Dehalococcoidia bacterium]|nr:ATP-binding protein [Dehalococcoidia bacterium]